MVSKEVWMDLLYPRRCAVCDGIAGKPGRKVCPKCADKIKYIREPYCMKCGKQLQHQEAEFCQDCKKHDFQYIQGQALYDYGSMADSIFRFKYKGRREYAEFFGEELFREKGSWVKSLNPDVLIPVPIHPSRKNNRGYNQAELIALSFSRYIQIPVNMELIVRTKKTIAQKNLGERERQNNLKKAFKMCRNDVKLSTIVIIDDIYTTGSTVNAMAEVLMQAGAKRIYFVALAVGRG